MRHKCDGCYWKTDWEDETGAYHICERLCCGSFENAKSESVKPGDCAHYFPESIAPKVIKIFDEAWSKRSDSK